MNNPFVPTPARGGTSFGLDDYQLRLPTFEGPLDVLLRLVEREHLSIAEVSLISVTEQFLAYFNALEARDASTITAFASVAGRLVLLKSRALLPRPLPSPDEPDPDDLVRQLEEYRRVKAIALDFADQDGSGFAAFPRGTAVLGPEAAPPRIAIHPPDILARALRRRLSILAPPLDPAPLRPLLKLHAVVSSLIKHVRPDRPLSLNAFLRDGDRQFRLVTFLAVLVLLRRRTIEVEQPEQFGDIQVSTMPRDHAARLAS